jgi:hypothetical protein
MKGNFLIMMDVSPTLMISLFTAFGTFCAGYGGIKYAMKNSIIQRKEDQKSNKESIQMIESSVAETQKKVHNIETNLPKLITFDQCDSRQIKCSGTVNQVIAQKIDNVSLETIAIRGIISDMYNKHDKSQEFMREIALFMGEVKRYMLDHNGDRTEQVIKECMEALIDNAKLRDKK